jgi:hypothetical protein
MTTEMLQGFRRPFLAADSVDTIGGDCIVLRRGPCTLEIETAGGDIDAAIRLLEALQDPAAEEWRRPGVGDLVQQLSLYGWIAESGETRSPGGTDVRLEAEQWLREGVKTAGNEAHLRLISIARRVTTLAEQRAAGMLICAWPKWRNSAEGALLTQLASWQRSAPATLTDVASAFCAAVNQPLAMECPAESSQCDRARVWQACSLLALALLSPDTAPYELPPFPGGQAINVLADAERVAVHLSELGATSPLQEMIADPRRAARLAAAVFAHQAFVSTHYVECLLPLLSLKSPPPLRRRLRQYFVEELGHEEHELEAACSVGSKKEDVLALVPVPFMGAYVDVLAHLAEADPVAFLLCITIAEGLPGSSKSLASQLEQASGAPALGKHSAIDAALNHSFKARELAREWGAVSDEAGQRALERFVDVLRLTQGGWRQVAAAAAADWTWKKPFELSMGQVVEHFASA